MRRQGWMIAALALVLMASVFPAEAVQWGAGTGTSYPTTLDTSNTRTNKSGASCDSTHTTYMCAEWFNDWQAAVIAIQAELGTLPKGSYASVAARLNATFNLTPWGSDINAAFYALSNLRSLTILNQVDFTHPGYITQYNNASLAISLNRSTTEVSADVNAAAARISLGVGNGDSSITLMTTATNNAVPAARLRIEANGNFDFNGGGTPYGGGVGVLGINAATTEPTSNPGNGGILWVSGSGPNIGALMYRSASGTVTKVAPL